MMFRSLLASPNQPMASEMWTAGRLHVAEDIRRTVRDVVYAAEYVVEEATVLSTKSTVSPAMYARSSEALPM